MNNDDKKKTLRTTNEWLFGCMHVAYGWICFLSLYLCLFHIQVFVTVDGSDGRHVCVCTCNHLYSSVFSLSLCFGPHPLPFQVRCASSSWTRLCSTSASMTMGPTRWPIRNSLMPSSSLCPTTVTWVGFALAAHCCLCTGEKERAEKGRRYGATECAPPQKSTRTGHKS